MDMRAAKTEPTNLAPHPQRARVLAEVHARPFTAIETPRRILHFGFMTDPAAAAADQAELADHCASLGLSGPPPGAKHHQVSFSGALLRWERHNEFTTYTWEFDPEEGEGTLQPFQPTPDHLASPMSVVPQPGPLLVAVDLHLVPQSAASANPERIVGAIQVAAAEAEGGAAMIVTDFQPDVHGFVRVLVVDRGMTPAQAGALVQRVLEVETYRTLALLGLPEAHRLGPALRRIEAELPRLMDQMQTSDGLETNRALLDRLTALAAELETGAAESLFRFGATRAYDELVRLRLEAIGERPIPGLSSWSAFLARRLAPAIRTCISTEERQANLSSKLARAADLLRTRVEIEVQNQNRDLLHTMNERGRVQLRLQQTVEGLSVAAISYYVASLAHLVLEGAHGAGVHVDPALGTAVVVPFALVGVAWVVRCIRQSHGDVHS
jgi:uncharacterized membrane-anchored protein